MKPIKPLQWFCLILLSILSIYIWIVVALPRYQIIDLSLDRNAINKIARDYVGQKMAIDLSNYQQAVIFSMDSGADRYLQKTLGPESSQEFIKKNNYDLFYWIVRFFKEKQKEEFQVVISSKTGQVIGYTHSLEQTAARPLVDQDKARQQAIDFLTQNYAFLPEEHTIHGQNTQKQENRMDYSFTWEKNNVGIPWDERYGGGKAKLLVHVGVSGHEILYFNQSQLSIPEGFGRHIETLKQTGANLTMLFRILLLALLTIAISLLVNRRRHVVPRMVKPFYLAAGIGLFVSIVMDMLNGFQNMVFGYPTTQSFWEYIIRGYVGSSVDVFLIVLAFILPGLAGEALRYETAPEKKNTGMLNNILSSFWTRPIAQQIWVGYLMTAVLLATQACIFQIGYAYFGVWNELSWLAQTSSALVPALTVFVVGFHASFSEEIMFRLFAINLLKRYGLHTILAVVMSAVVWGFGHTGYAVFPMWFRGLEVSCLGLIFGFIYLRYGLVAAITAHFTMDAFWSSLQYLINPKLSFDLMSCLFVLCLPLLFSLVALVLNRSTQEKPWKKKFTAQQEFNYQLLKKICSTKSAEELSAFKEELIHHGWDPAIIERVYEEEKK